MKLSTAVSFLVVSLIVASNFLHSNAKAQEPVPVDLTQNGDSWQLRRAGHPYYISGAGGDGPLRLLAKFGGNSSRIWGVDANTRNRLDEANRNGVTIALGVWLEHERMGFDYKNPHHLEFQKRQVRDAINRYKDHPAVLVWGIGNEMEGYAEGDDPAVWKHVDDLCKMAKEIDPHHPTMSVIAEIGGSRIKAIHKYCPNLDIIGINSYGGATSLPQRYREAGGKKPYIVTEFGPAGAWEVGRNNLDTVDEIPTNKKTEMYLSSYKSLTNDSKLCLGTYAFLWGSKLETTETWFGMLLEDGRRTSIVDAMSEQWTGKRPENRCPEIQSLTLSGTNEFKPGELFELSLSASDPEGDRLSTQWSVRPEVPTYITYGDPLPPLARMDYQVIDSSNAAAKIQAPKKPGLYRVYCFVGDDHGGAAATSLSFKVVDH